MATITIASLVDVPGEKVDEVKRAIEAAVRRVAAEHQADFREVFTRTRDCVGELSEEEASHSPCDRVAANKRVFNWNSIPEDF